MYRERKKERKKERNAMGEGQVDGACCSDQCCGRRLLNERNERIAAW